MKRFFLFALVATMFVACVTDEVRDVATEVTPDTLTVSFEGDDSRIQLQNGKTVWTQGDLVSVFYRSDAHDQYEFQGETGDTEGTLKRTQRGTPSVGLDKIVAVYPYSDKNLIELLTGNIQAFMPATQNYAKDSYGVGSSIMVSSSRTNTLYMKNVCGWLKVQLKGEGQVVKSITIKGNNGEQVAGNIFITADTAECTLATALNGADENNSGDLVGTLVDPTTILTEVTLDCGDGVELGAEPTAFYIALPPQTFEKGLTVKVTCDDFSTMTKTTENSIAIERNTIQPMAAFEAIFPEPKPANNEIWYAATAKVEPYYSGNFGANIVSNEWNAETKQGIITFDGNVTSIGEYAFVYCSRLTSIAIPDGVTSIGYGAFGECSSLTRVTIGNSVTSIGEYAFVYCSSLTRVTIGNSVTSIGEYAFAGCSRLTSVTIGNSVTSIGSLAFYGCSSLTAFYGKFASADNRCLIVDGVLNSFAPAGLNEYTIPDSVTSIGNYAFSGCTSLTSVTIPDSVTSIGEGAFYDCASLKEVYCKSTTPPTGGRDMFSYFYYSDDITGNMPIGCTIYVPHASVVAYKAAEYWRVYADNIISYDFEKGETVVENVILYTATKKVTPDNSNAFGANIVSNEWSSETKQGIITFDGNITEIGNNAFYNCTSLTSITIPDSVTSIGFGAFINCSSLTSVTIGNSVTSIGEYAFHYCSRLTAFYGKFASADNRCLIVDGVLNSFAIGCGLTEYTIPDSITSIGNYAFDACTSLTSVTIPDSVTEIGESAFRSCSSLTAFYGKFASADNRCLIVDGVLNSFAIGCGLTEYTIPDSITSIGEYAFEGCHSLTSVTIPDSVTSIGEYAFHYCYNLTSITIPDSVTSIGMRAFHNCVSLKEVYCKSTTPPTGGRDMFSYFYYSDDITGNTPIGCKIYVPRESVEVYKNAPYWSEYASDIEGYDF